jgi:AcrR family transcriptional regulator
VERQTAARPGRKRSEESRQAILTATLELVGDVGYGRLTIEAIAARAGVGKQTIYRWWPSKADVLLDALTAKASIVVPEPNEGSYVADLRAFLLATFTLGRDPRVVDVLRALMTHAQLDPAFGERFRERFLQARRDALGALLDRAAARGDLPAAPSKGTVADIVFGIVWYRILATQQPLDQEQAEELLALLS